jgi:hypothetical protein
LNLHLNKKLNFKCENNIKREQVVKFLRKGKGCCVNYILKSYPKKTLFVEDCFNDIVDNYKIVQISRAKIGDIISFHNIRNNNPSESNCNHFAKIIYTNGTIRGTIIRSKWGKMGIYESRIDDLPRTYGNFF